MSVKTNDTEIDSPGSVDQPSEPQHTACDHAGYREATAPPTAIGDNPPVADSGRSVAVRRTSILTSVIRAAPTVIVTGALAGLGYFGHHHGWTIPKFSELTGQTPATSALWCELHSVPEAECISCNADLMPKGQLHGWCKEHGVHECVLHHSHVAQLREVPEILQADLERATRAIALRPRPQNNQACKTHLRRIQFPSMATADKAGIDIGLVDRGPIVETVSATGEAIYDPTRVAGLASRAAGTVWRVDKNVGDCVTKGDILALVDAVEVGRAKAALFRAAARYRLQTKTYNRLAGLGTVVAGSRTLEAETALAEAEVAIRESVQALVNLGLVIAFDKVVQAPADTLARDLQFLGLPPVTAEQLDPARTTSNLIPVVAPRDGIVVMRDAVGGEVIDTAKPLFTVVDTSRMWLILNVSLEDAQRVAPGQKVVFFPDGADHTDTGTVTWISTDVDTDTRTVQIRGVIPNDDGHLRNKTFGAGAIVLREEDDAILVPSTALHWEGCCHVVFVRDKSYMKEGCYKVFHTRSVRPGAVVGDTTEMLAGLLPGEVIVTKGSGVLRAELLKGNLGAG